MTTSPLMTKPSRILLVDDTHAIHDDLRKVLGCVEEDARTVAFDALDAELFGSAPQAEVALRCDSAYQGEQAFELVKRACADADPYSVAIVDMRMPPGWDGLETIRHLWSVDPELQVIICTAHSDWTWTQIVEALGEKDNLLILKKPFAPVEVNQMVLALVQKWLMNQRIRRYTRELEDRVAARTRSLVDANARLTREIAERERIEDALRMSQRLESLGRLAAGVAHEINNPLQFIMSNHEFAVELLDDVKAEGGLTHTVEDLVGQTRGAVLETHVALVRIAEIVRDLKTYARNAGQRNERLDVHAVVRRAVKFAAHETYDMEVRLRLDEVPQVYGASTRFEQVITNLIVNAAQALRASKGKPLVEVVSRQDGEAVLVEVIDGGPGIPSEVLTKIWDPFFTTKSPGGGTGLGLSISRNIVGEMGGTIEIDTAVGKGTTFRLRLPSASAEVDATNATHVLAIDDDPQVTTSVRKILSDRHAVSVMHDPIEALAQLAQGAKFDVICCDLSMPGMTGVELYERVCEMRPELAPRFIFLSPHVAASDATTSDQLPVRGRGMGLPPLLADPFDQVALSREVDALLRTTS
jgi:two-component system NtrC family sensor kinase